MRRLVGLAPTSLLLLLLAGVAQAGVSTATHIGITSTNALSGHESEATDPATAYYYDIRTDGFLWRDSTLKSQGTQTLKNYSSVALSTSASAGYNYLAQTNHWVVAYFQSGSNWDDNVGWSDVSAITYGGSASANPPFTQLYPSTQSYYIATGYLGDTTYAPHINGINVIGSTTPGSSGYIEVYGTDLAKWAGATTSSISGSGVSTSVIYQDYTNPTQVNLSYSITGGATPGNRNLTVDTPWGAPSNAVTFTIDP